MMFNTGGKIIIGVIAPEVPFLKKGNYASTQLKLNNKMKQIETIIAEQLNKENEKREITSWQISKLGSCLRGIYLERLGIEPDVLFDDRTLRVFSVGKQMEEWLVSLIKKDETLKIETQVRVEDLKLNVSGYADMSIEENGNKVIYEIKSKHSKSFWFMVKKGEGAMEQHRMQLWSYLYLLKVSVGYIVYLSKDDLSIAEFEVRLDDKRLGEAVMNEISLLNKAWELKDPSLLSLPPEKDWRGNYCRWHQGHCKNL